MNKAEQFFYYHAGWSYTPTKETPEQGRTRCAVRLAAAEVAARDAGVSFHWQKDRLNSSEWTTEVERIAHDGNPEPWDTWECIARDAQGAYVAGLFGIDFGRGGEPLGSMYRRCVEAELACECVDAE